MDGDELPRRIGQRAGLQFTDHFLRRDRGRQATTAGIDWSLPASDRANAPCAACGSTATSRRLNRIGGIEISLCKDVSVCTGHYRCGLQPDQYAVLLRLEIDI